MHGAAFPEDHIAVFLGDEIEALKGVSCISFLVLVFLGGGLISLFIMYGPG
jgi:hypothetical protein